MSVYKGKVIDGREMVYLDDVLDILDEIIMMTREMRRGFLQCCEYEDGDEWVYILNPERKEEIMAFIEKTEKEKC